MLRRIPGCEGLDHERHSLIEKITELAAAENGHDELLKIVKDFPELIDAPNEVE